MNLFGSKKEAYVMAVVAAFFVLLAFGFTIEPLVALLLKTRSMPAGTTSYLIMTHTLKTKNDFLSEEIIKTAPLSDVWAEKVPLLQKNIIPIADMEIVSAVNQPTSAIISVSNRPEVVISYIRRFLSKFHPFEIKTTLPDQTSMTETVIDPGLIEIKTDNSPNPVVWTFTQANPQLTVKKNGSNAIIYLNYPQVVNSQGVESITSCSIGPTGIKTVTFNTLRKTLITGLFSSFLAYFKHYSCFQSFSTFVR